MSLESTEKEPKYSCLVIANCQYKTHFGPSIYTSMNGTLKTTPASVALNWVNRHRCDETSSLSGGGRCRTCRAHPLVLGDALQERGVPCTNSRYHRFVLSATCTRLIRVE
jgi:hypothetical protein